MHKFLTLTATAAFLVGCTDIAEIESTPKPADTAQSSVVADTEHAATAKINAAKLSAVLDAQSDKAKARFEARHPAETLAFFGIEPGMAVGEALPGGGWYTKVLVPYLGENGKLIGIDYSLDMWPEFSFANEEFIENKKKWPTEFVTKAAEWAPADGAGISATTFGDEAGSNAGTLDAVLFVRALHNLSRFETEGQYMTEAISTTHSLLKTGGIVGVVQHRAPETSPDAWADGSAGYLKSSKIIAAFDVAGFDLVKSSEINANPKDRPTVNDIVWRLPPSLRGSDETKDARTAIGESDRMTLLFKKR